MYIASQNLLTLSSFPGVDPETDGASVSSSAYPQARSFTIGLNLNF